MAQHFRVKKLLSEEIKKIESEIVAKQKVAEPKIEEKPGTVRRRQVELHE